jgi:methylenetetrahydrofolate dehydrogenase (NADP+)/methenyltetrahydrofolate cyclohydrolase
MTLISGKTVSAAVREEIKKEVSAFHKETGRTPGLAVILVGNDPASAVYERNKHKACEELGIASFMHILPEETDESELLQLIDTLNRDEAVDGILCQLPLPKGISEEKVISAISPEKDVDAFHPENVGKIMTGNYSFLPCTPAGVMELLKFYGVSVSGKNCVVIGRSNIVGKPQALLLLEQNGTVEICHSRTQNLKEHTLRADILIVAIGKPNFVTADMVKPDAVVIDVGINRLPDGKLCGDVNFEAVKEKVSFITPVPGGVGPMTITMLMKNTLTAAKERQKKYFEKM